MSVFQEEEYSKKVDFTLWKQLLAYAKPYKGQLAFLVFVNVLAGVIDVLFPMMNRYAIDNFIVKGTRRDWQVSSPIWPTDSSPGFKCLVPYLCSRQGRGFYGL